MGDEITAKDLKNVVMIALMGKNPENGMKLKPRDKRIREGRVVLEYYLEWINRGIKAAQEDREREALGLPF